MPKGHSELPARIDELEAQVSALIKAVRALEHRQAQMDEAFAKGYMPSPGGLIGGSRGP